MCECNFYVTIQKYKNCIRKTTLRVESCINVYKEYVNVFFFNVQKAMFLPFQFRLLRAHRLEVLTRCASIQVLMV